MKYSVKPAVKTVKAQQTLLNSVFLPDFFLGGDFESIASLGKVTQATAVEFGKMVPGCDVAYDAHLFLFFLCICYIFLELDDVRMTLGGQQ